MELASAIKNTRGSDPTSTGHFGDIRQLIVAWLTGTSDLIGSHVILLHSKFPLATYWALVAMERAPSTTPMLQAYHKNGAPRSASNCDC